MVGRRHAAEEAEGQLGVVPELREGLLESFRLEEQRDLVPGQQHVREGRAEPVGELDGLHRTVPVVRTFSWSFRMPNISISGFGGQPGT